MSQREIIRQHLHTYRTITSWEAIQKYHITRLAAVISLLRDDGHVIDSVPQYVNGKKGRKYVLYVLRKENGDV